MSNWYLGSFQAPAQRLRTWLEGQSLLRRTRWYWLKACAAILLGIYLGGWLSGRYVGMPLRYQVSQLQQLLMPIARARWTALLLIDDDEYWKGTPARRSPIRRDYLASLLRTVSSCDPWVIALDFDFRSPVVDGTLRDNPAYRSETESLVSALRTVSKRSPVVLPITISNDHTFVEASFLDEVSDTPGEVARGTITLPWDYREIPTSELVDHRKGVDSFALATAGFVNPGLFRRFPPDRDFPFAATFITQGNFPTILYREGPQFPSPAQCRSLRHRVVIVAAAWHRNAYHRGDFTDMRQDTPMGPVVAAFLHANYVEALLQDRMYSSLGKVPAFLIEVLSSALVALVLATSWNRSVKFIVAGATAVLLLFLTYVFAQNVGLYADFFFAVIFLFMHALWNYWDELKQAAATLLQVELELRQARAELTNLRQSRATTP